MVGPQLETLLTLNAPTESTEWGCNINWAHYSYGEGRVEPWGSDLPPRTTPTRSEAREVVEGLAFDG